MTRGLLSGHRWLLPGFAVLGALLAIRLARVAEMTLLSIRYPYQLDYGEGVVWQQAQLMTGADAYGPITNFPFIVFHYPPLYHLAARALAWPGIDPLMAGRTVSILGLVALAIAVATIVLQVVGDRAGRTSRVVAVCVMLLVLLTCQPILHFARLMRVDLLAMALSFTGLALALGAFRRPRLLYAAVLVFVAAVFTKQTLILGPAAVFAVMLWRDWRLTARAIALGLACGGAAALAVHLATGGGFFRHIIFYNMNPFTLGAYLNLIAGLRDHAIYPVLALAALVLLWRSTRPAWPTGRGGLLAAGPAAPRETCILLALTLYAALAHAFTLTGGKFGASTNYFIESMSIWALLIGAASGRLLEGRGSAKPWHAVWPAVLAAQALLLPLFGNLISGVQITNRPEMEALAALTERVRTAPLPVLTDDIVLLTRAGKRMPWEPAIFTDLAAHGIWDEEPAVRMIRDRKLAFILLERESETGRLEAWFSPAVRTAIAAAYPRSEVFAGRRLLLPP